MRCMLGVERVAAGRVRVYRREFASFSGYEFGDSCNSSLRDMPARMPALPVIFAFFAHFRGDEMSVWRRGRRGHALVCFVVAPPSKTTRSLALIGG
jgi:hypothetical protein